MYKKSRYLILSGALCGLAACQIAQAQYNSSLTGPQVEGALNKVLATDAALVDADDLPTGKEGEKIIYSDDFDTGSGLIDFTFNHETVLTGNLQLSTDGEEIAGDITYFLIRGDSIDRNVSFTGTNLDGVTFLGGEVLNDFTLEANKVARGSIEFDGTSYFVSIDYLSIEDIDTLVTLVSGEDWVYAHDSSTGKDVKIAPENLVPVNTTAYGETWETDESPPSSDDVYAKLESLTFGDLVDDNTYLMSRLIYEPDQKAAVEDKTPLFYIDKDQFPDGITVNKLTVSSPTAWTNDSLVLTEYIEDLSGSATQETLAFSPTGTINDYLADDFTDNEIVAGSHLLIDWDTTPDDIPSALFTMQYTKGGGGTGGVGTNPGKTDLLAWYDFDSADSVGGNLLNKEGTTSYNMSEQNNPVYSTEGAITYGTSATATTSHWLNFANILNDFESAVTSTRSIVVRYRTNSNTVHNSSIIARTPRLQITWRTTTTYAKFGSSSTYAVSSGIAPPDEQWSTIVLSRTPDGGTNEVRLYEDGELVASDLTGNTDSQHGSGSDFTIGYYIAENNVASDFDIDFVGLYLRELTQDEITWLSRPGFTREFSDLTP
jgi:hypothetical protein